MRNGKIERVNRTMGHMLSNMVMSEKQNAWDTHLPHDAFMYDDLVRAATGLGLNEMYVGRIPRLPLTAFKQPNSGGYPILDRDQLAYVLNAAPTLVSRTTMPSPSLV